MYKDDDILLFIQKHRSNVLNTFFTYLTHTGSGRAWMFYAILVFSIPGQKNILEAMYGPLLAWPLSSILKRIFKRARPFLSVKNLVPLIESPTCFSFPSTHTATTFSLFGTLYLMNHPLAAFAFVWASLTSFSRIYLGVHFPSDIVGGIVLGISSAVAIFYLR